MFGFRRTADGVQARFAAFEAELLREAAGAVVAAAGDDDRADPVVARLFPDAHREDPLTAIEFRALAEDELRAGKAEAARALAAAVPGPGRVTLAAAEAESWLTALNDMRLLLGTRLGVTDDEGPELDPEDPRFAAWQAYYWLTELQATLVDALSDP